MITRASLFVLIAAVASCRGGDAGVPTPAPATAPEAPAAAAQLELGSLSGELLFVSDRDGEAAVFVARPGATPERLSPDGAAYYPVGIGGLAIETIGEEEQHVERLVQLAGGQLVRAYEPASARLRNPSLSPDGSWVVFESDRHSFRDLYRLELESGALTRLTEDTNGAFEPSVSPDGRRIAFVSSDTGDPEIYVMNADGSERERVTAFHLEDTAPRWSPDGRQLVFTSDREGADRLFVTNADGTGQRRLTTRTETGELEAAAVWSPDGTLVAHVVRRAGESSEVWVTEVASGAMTRVSPLGAQDSDPAWSPDGRHLVFGSKRDGNVDLVIARADGTASAQAVSTTGEDWLPRWTAVPIARIAAKAP